MCKTIQSCINKRNLIDREKTYAKDKPGQAYFHDYKAISQK
ncbi:hypothetical protein EV11_0500 [Prochlorococcus sp. SS52]|nr:hypothetical protein EV08_0521 [Prochlorococcus marinus str. SS2]KGG36720.1 hypothetical protein EV11_0500 [Prochlorococcus sp. SS52]